MTTKKQETTTNAAGKAVADKVGEMKQSGAAQKEAATELAKEALQKEARASTGTESEVDPDSNRWLGSDEIQMHAHLLEGGIGALEKAIDKKEGIPEEKVAGLLILERNGQNRTEFVKLLKTRLGIKDIRKELPMAGGPDYTNDTTNLSDL